MHSVLPVHYQTPCRLRFV